MSKGIKISKEGVDVKTAVNKDLLISSQFDTFKVKMSGTLSVVYPEQTIASDAETTTSVSVSHNLDYYPIVFPFVQQEVSYIDNQDYGFETPVTGPYIINDLADEIIPAGSSWFPGLVGEFSYIEITTTQLILHIRRFNFDFFGESLTFVESEPTLYYTIFYNRIDEAMDLL